MPTTKIADDSKEFSRPLALTSGVLLFIFTGFSSLFIVEMLRGSERFHLWFFYPLLLWVLLMTFALCVWGWKAGSIGHPTLEMIGGVSGAIFAAVTLALILATTILMPEKTKLTLW